MCNNSAKSSGFTLVELMITLVIAGILAALGIPSFNSTISSSRLTSYANEFVTALNLARSEAVKRGTQVTVIRRKGSTPKQWESGWDVFVDLNANEDFDDDSPNNPCETNVEDGSLKEDCLLRTYDALPSGYTLRTGNSTYKDYAAYASNGLSTVPVGDTFTLCSRSGTAVTQRTITVIATGRARVAEATGTCP